MEHEYALDEGVVGLNNIFSNAEMKSLGMLATFYFPLII
jgi:hypothetical protein